MVNLSIKKREMYLIANLFFNLHKSTSSNIDAIDAINLLTKLKKLEKKIVFKQFFTDAIVSINDNFNIPKRKPAKKKPAKKRSK